MRKYIELSEEVIARLVCGKCVEGSLRRDEWTGKVSFRAYQRQPRIREKDRLVKKLPWGWVKESLLRVKRYSSLPKELTLPEKLAILDEENELAKNALIESYIIESV
jgi:hypothetical protein